MLHDCPLQIPWMTFWMNSCDQVMTVSITSFSNHLNPSADYQNSNACGKALAFLKSSVTTNVTYMYMWNCESKSGFFMLN